MKNLKLILGLILITTLFSFETEKSDFIGKFGTSYDNSSTLLLEVNDDFTFHYKDLTNPKNKLEVYGTWEQKGNKLVLTNSKNNAVAFHDEWKLANNGNSLKGRLKMCFYTISRLN